MGILTYLQGTSHPDISMAVHQTACFCANPMISHQQTIMRLGKYLNGTSDIGLILSPDQLKGLECYIDADFAGN